MKTFYRLSNSVAFFGLVISLLITGTKTFAQNVSMGGPLAQAATADSYWRKGSPLDKLVNSVFKENRSKSVCLDESDCENTRTYLPIGMCAGFAFHLDTQNFINQISLVNVWNGQGWEAGCRTSNSFSRESFAVLNLSEQDCLGKGAAEFYKLLTMDGPSGEKKPYLQFLAKLGTRITTFDFSHQQKIKDEKDYGLSLEYGPHVLVQSSLVLKVILSGVDECKYMTAAEIAKRLDAGISRIN